jgi:hypothetical protein
MIRIGFNDLDFQKQEEIRRLIKEEVIYNLDNEARKKGITLDELLKENYNVGCDMNDEEREIHWKSLVEDFLEEQVEDKLSGWYCEASWY